MNWNWISLDVIRFDYTEFPASVINMIITQEFEPNKYFWPCCMLNATSYIHRSCVTFDQSHELSFLSRKHKALWISEWSNLFLPLDLFQAYEMFEDIKLLWQCCCWHWFKMSSNKHTHTLLSKYMSDENTPQALFSVWPGAVLYGGTELI